MNPKEYIGRRAQLEAEVQAAAEHQRAVMRNLTDRRQALAAWEVQHPALSFEAIPETEEEVAHVRWRAETNQGPCFGSIVPLGSVSCSSGEPEECFIDCDERSPVRIDFGGDHEGTDAELRLILVRKLRTMKLIP